MIWDDEDDRDSLRPDELYLILSSGMVVRLTEADGWTETVSGLPKYDDGEEIEYTWQEAAVPGGYTLSGNFRDGTVTTLTNSLTSRLTAVRMTVTAPISVGDFITFGRYEQDNNTDNGPEEIEWQVLAVEDDRALVISRYALDAKPYNEEDVDVTWETCTLRAWLNGTFYESAFSPVEKGYIREVTNQNPGSPYDRTTGGNDTKDLLFLLSTDEVNKYFENDDSRMCEASAFAKANGAWVSNFSGNSVWWLRSPGSSYHNAAAVFVSAGGYGVRHSFAVVRPAFWLDRSDGQEKSANGSTPAADPEPSAVPAAEQEPASIPAAEPEPAPVVTVTPEQEIHEGDIIIFGRYEQDNNTDNGPEEIEWQVLAVEDGRALVISRYGLDVKPYNEEDAYVTWETCTLRAWLNGTFHDSAFSPEEKGRIREVTNQNPGNPDYYWTEGGNNTKDKIFLLSMDEAKKYFSNADARICEATAYAKANGAWVSNNGNSHWWLRSPGVYLLDAEIVYFSGHVVEEGYVISGRDTIVRPAFWLDLSGGQIKPAGRLEKMSDGPAAESAQSSEMTIPRDLLLYKSPSLGASVMRSILAGNTVTVLFRSLSEMNIWVKVRTGKGEEGWILETWLN